LSDRLRGAGVHVRLNTSNNSGGDAASDSLSGGPGKDVASYATSSAGVAARLGRAGTNSGDAADDKYHGIENLTGSPFADTLAGNGGNNRLNGARGSDLLGGQAGADTLSGGKGADTLAGGPGTDSLVGGHGHDILTGGTGANNFIFSSLAASSLDSHRNRITDLVKGIDHIDVSGIDARAGVAGNQAFDFIHGAFTGHKGELHSLNVGANSRVVGDVDGDRNADFSILVEGVNNLHAGDFVL